MDKNSIYTILWNDAAFTFEKELPANLPNPRLTVGFIILENNEFVFLSTNVDFNKETNKILPKDGFVIPKKTILKITKIT